MKKYNISNTRCNQCGGLISWDDYPAVKYPVHVNNEGFKIGDGGCWAYRATLSSPNEPRAKGAYTGRSSLDDHTKKIILSFVLIAVIVAVPLLIVSGIYYGDPALYEGDEKGDEQEDDDEDLTGPYVGYEIDEQGNCYYIVDGDTFDVEFGDAQDRIRLADVDTPEVSEPGYQEAKDHTASLVEAEMVYLDIDDKYGKDVYGRWVAVAYIRYNSTHLRNVNKDLLLGGYAVLDDYDNEFNPNSWNLYVEC